MKLFSVLIAFFLLVPARLSADSAVFDLRARTPVNAAMRSALLPGWGQWFNGEETKGYIAGGAFTVTALASYLLYSQANTTYGEYEKKGVKNDPLFSEYETQSNQALIASLLAAGVWIYAVADAYIAGGKSEKESEDESRYIERKMTLAFSGGSPRLVYRMKFE